MMLDIVVIVLSIVFISYAAVKLGWHPFYLLIGTSIVLGFIILESPQDVAPAIGRGFGDMLGRIAFIIIFGAFLGNLLFAAKAMDRIAIAIFSGSLSRFPSLAMGLTGLVVGIPVFCDAGYVVLSHLPKSLEVNKKGKVAMALMLAAGLYLAHTLIPPTPGPMAALGAFKMISFTGQMVLWGALLSLTTLLVLFLWLNKGLSKDAVKPNNADPQHEKGSFGKALFALMLPLVLIAVGNAVPAEHSPALDWLIAASQPSMALFISCGVAILFYLKEVRHSIKAIAESTLSQTAPILLLTGAGGALGNVISKAEFLSLPEMTASQSSSGFMVIISGFLIAALIKTMQGSSTGAIVITAALLSPIVDASFMTDEGIFLVLAIGAGSLAVSHTNDSYFWVIAKLEKWSTKEAINYWTLASVVISVVSMFFILLIYALKQWIF